MDCIITALPKPPSALHITYMTDSQPISTSNDYCPRSLVGFRLLLRLSARTNIATVHIIDASNNLAVIEMSLRSFRRLPVMSPCLSRRLLRLDVSLTMMDRRD